VGESDEMLPRHMTSYDLSHLSHPILPPFLDPRISVSACLEFVASPKLLGPDAEGSHLGLFVCDYIGAQWFLGRLISADAPGMWPPV
jgi:hypothetical protein